MSIKNESRVRFNLTRARRNARELMNPIGFIWEKYIDK